MLFLMSLFQEMSQVSASEYCPSKLKMDIKKPALDKAGFLDILKKEENFITMNTIIRLQLR